VFGASWELFSATASDQTHVDITRDEVEAVLIAKSSGSFFEERQMGRGGTGGLCYSLLFLDFQSFSSFHPFQAIDIYIYIYIIFFFPLSPPPSTRFLCVVVAVQSDCARHFRGQRRNPVAPRALREFGCVWDWSRVRAGGGHVGDHGVEARHAAGKKKRAGRNRVDAESVV